MRSGFVVVPIAAFGLLSACTPDVATTTGGGAGGAATSTSSSTTLATTSTTTTSSTTTTTSSGAPVCGDGSVDPGGEEECDDGNGQDGDGCSGCVVDGGSCAVPHVESVTSAGAVLHGTIAAASPQLGASCAADVMSRAQIYELHTMTAGFLTVTTIPSGNGSNLVLLLEKRCGVEDGYCSDIAPPTRREILSRPVVAQGTYYLVVVGLPGPFDVVVDLSTGETCADPIPLVFDGDPYAITADIGVAQNNSESSNGCGGAGNDLVYTLTPGPSAAGAATVTLTPTVTWRPVLHTRTNCPQQATQEDCDGALVEGDQVTINVILDAVNPRSFIVDRYNSLSGNYTMVIQ